MIYLDSSATSFQKPPSVCRAMEWAIRNCSSPGRGGYPAANRGAEVVYRCRERIGEWMETDSPEQVIFTSSATHALNLAIRSLVRPGDSVVISGYEHNAVTRTLQSIPNVTVQAAFKELFSPESDVEAFRRLITHNTRAVICNHVSNVFGYILPMDEIAALCRERGVPLIVDASQSAGILPISMKRWTAAYIGFPGHKGLYGPQGTGVLLCGSGSQPEPLFTGGTGSESKRQGMPDFLPDRLEAGTHNVPGIAGLGAGVQFVQQKGSARIAAHEAELARYLAQQLAQDPRIEVFLPQRHTGVVSFRLKNTDVQETAQYLSQQGIALRAGCHCAPLAHKSAGTLDTGTLRASFSAFSRQEDALALVQALRKYREK